MDFHSNSLMRNPWKSIPSMGEIQGNQFLSVDAPAGWFTINKLLNLENYWLWTTCIELFQSFLEKVLGASKSLALPRTHKRSIEVETSGIYSCVFMCIYAADESTMKPGDVQSQNPILLTQKHSFFSGNSAKVIYMNVFLMSTINTFVKNLFDRY